MRRSSYNKKKLHTDLHKTLLSIFLKYHGGDMNIEKLFNKFPVLGADYMFNRVVVVTNDTVYKIHPVEYTEKQRELIKNLKLFFENYSQPLDITEYYKEDLCWTTWTRIPGDLLGKGHLEDHIWEKYLTYVTRTWNEHCRRSEELNTPEGQMWWHYDVTPWNIIVQPDDSFFLVDWDDFRLMSIEEAKQWTIDQNIEYAEMNNQDENRLQDLQW